MLSDSKLFLAWDLAKMYRSDGTVIAEVENFFINHIDKIRECHLHDRTVDHGHQIIGQGYVDFRHYLSLLSERPVEYTIEVRPIDNAVKSLTELRKMLTNRA
jgi:sugar phosphate isomerase/epimerase